MTIDFLPAVFTRATRTTVVVPVCGHPDITDPATGRVVIPASVDITLTVVEGGPTGDRTRTSVCVTGPRRLKSGAAGQPITTAGWHVSRNDGPRGYVARPEWLTALLNKHTPATV